MNGTPSSLEAALSAGIAALLAMQRPDGRFVYRTGPHVRADESRYNILRHAGALYALVECRAWSARNPADAVAAGLRWVERNHLRPIVRRRLMLAVASDDAGRGDYDVCKLGGTALFLLAAARATEEGMIAYPLAALRALGAFLIGMQREDGGFLSKYLRDARRADPSFASLYYPGEAALALLQLHRLDPEGPWLNAAESALDQLARTGAGATAVAPDHWSLIATARYLETQRPPEGDAQDRIRAHALRIVHVMLAEFEGDPERGGCCTRDGRTCPTATRLEGLCAIAPHLSIGDPALRTRVLAAIEQGAQFLLEAQIPDGVRAGGFPRTSNAWLAEPVRAPDRRAEEVRIDYIQHAICGLRGALETKRLAG